MDDDSSSAERSLNGGPRRLSSNGHGNVSGQWTGADPKTRESGAEPLATEPSPGGASRRLLHLGPLAGGAMVGVVLALGVMLVLAIAARRSAAPSVTSEALRAAIARWRQHGPRDYDMVVEVSGAQTGRYEVRVRDGGPIAGNRDGRPLNRRTATYWTVPGLFDVIQHDLKYVDDPQRGFNAPAGSTVILRAEFDPELGLPRTYQRSILGQSWDIEWQVTEFDRLE